MRLFDTDSDTVSVVVQVAPTPGKPPTPGPPSRAGELPPGPPLEVPHNLQRIRTAVTPPLQQQDQADHMHGESRSCPGRAFHLHAVSLHAISCMLQSSSRGKCSGLR